MIPLRMRVLGLSFAAGIVAWGAAIAQADCQLTRLLGSASDAGDVLGYSVAVSNDYILVGAPLTDGADENTGVAYVYRRVGVTWSEKSKLESPDANLNDSFGSTVAIGEDYLAVGAPLDDEAVLNGGAVYVYRRSGSSWMFDAKLMALDAEEDDELGTSLAIEGNYLIAGARLDDNGLSSGGAYVFFRDAVGWVQQQKLTASDAAAGDDFGASVDISGDSVVVGAPGDNVAASDSGSAYVFVRSGTTWTEQQRVSASDGTDGNELGRSVSISGEYVVAGSRLADFGGFNNAGAAYVFKRTNTTWDQQAKLMAADADDEDVFGVSVSIDGGFVVIGSMQDDDGGNNSGSAYMFRRNGTTWLQASKLTAVDDASGDQLGFIVALHGGWAVAGAPYNDDFGTSTGSAYVFGVALDCNGNAEADGCDILNETSNDFNGNGVPDECGAAPGDSDSDNDGDVDLADFAELQVCYRRGGGLAPECQDHDIEPDGDVDLDDYADYRAIISGP